MKNRNTLLIVAAGLLLTAAAPPRGFQQCTHGPFRGITQTNSQGQLIGEPDPGDWGCVQQRGQGPHGSAAPWQPKANLGGDPTDVCLGAAVPNPADNSTQINFELPLSTHVNLVIYGQQGGPGRTSIVRTLVDGDFATGFHGTTWDLTNDNGTRVEPGIYRAVMVAGDDALCGDIEVR